MDTSASLHYRDGTPPGQLAWSGLTGVEESLIRGRLVPRMWCSTGFVARGLWPVPGATQDTPLLPEIRSLPAESFDLEMDGQSLQGGWRWDGAGSEEPSRTGAARGSIRLSSTLRPVTLAVRTTTDGTGFLIRDLMVTNRSDRPAALSRVAPWSGMLWGQPWTPARPVPGEYLGEERPAFTLTRATDEEWGREGALRRRPLAHGVTRIEHTKGTSGNDDPCFVLTNEMTGEIAVLCLAWSGNWAFTARVWAPDAGPAALAFRLEPLGDAPIRVLAPGETVTTPAVHLGLFRGDLDTAVQALHTHERRTVFPPQPTGRGQRVIYNHWGYADWRITPDYLGHEMDLAADLGAELFVVDAGWFAPMTTDWARSVGSWRPHPDRFPQGLDPIVDHAHARGLLFGLWVEAERVVAESVVARAHPEWILRRDGEVIALPGTEPGGLLDLAVPECAAWMETEINRLITEYRLDMLRLDYNFYPGRGGEHESSGYLESETWRHVEAVQGIFDRVRARRPEVLLENCAGGGGRKDLGMAASFHTLWTSDWQSLPRTLQVLNGVSLFLAPERLNRLAGVAQDAHLHGDLDTQLRVPLFGHYALSGVTPHVAVWNPRQRERIRHYIRLYRDWIRPWIEECRVFHHTPVLAGGPEPRGWCVLEYVSAGGERAMAGVFRLAGDAPSAWVFRPRGLDRGASYRVRWDTSGQTAVMEGSRLVEGGITIDRPLPLTSELLLLERV